MSDLGVEPITGFKMLILSFKPSKFDKKTKFVITSPHQAYCPSSRRVWSRHATRFV